MAFPTGWLRKCKLTIQHGQVPADQTAFPVLITEACLPSEILVSGGGNAAQSDGGDIRFSSDSAGASQLACEIVTWDQTGGKAEIWVPVSILTAADVDIYVWYKAGGGLTQPAAGAAFGSQAVWDSNFKVIYHYADGSSLSATDSTSNGNNATVLGGVTATAGKIDGGANFNGSATGYMSRADNTSLRPALFTVSFWIKTSQTGNTVVLEKDDNNGFSVQIATNISLGMLVNVGASNSHIAINTTHYSPDGAWHHFGFIYGSLTFSSLNHGLVDGVEHTDTNTPSSPGYSTGPFYVGGRAAVAPTTMQMDEVRLSNVARSTNWITTEYNNQSSPGTFIVVGTPSASGGTIIPVIVFNYRQRRV